MRTKPGRSEAGRGLPRREIAVGKAEIAVEVETAGEGTNCGEVEYSHP